MTKELTRDIAAMIGSRICHDLISPVGAISNGVELLGMSSGNTNPELSLIAESVDNANARVKFFRIAFGMASAGQLTGRLEMVSILKALETARLKYEWLPETDMLRDEVKLACLMVLCIESAMPRGGVIKISNDNGQWCVDARADRLDPSPDLWARLGATATTDGLKPSEVQFILAPLQAELLNRQITAQSQDGVLRLMA